MNFRSFATKGTGHSILFAALGFGLAGLVGALAGAMLFRTGLVALLVNLVSEAQPLQRLLVAIFLFIVGVAISGAVTGAIGGWLLSLIDPLAVRRRYMIAGSVAFAIPQTVVTSLALLLMGILGIYYNNIDTQAVHFTLLFAIFGLAYGVFVGLLFGFASVGFKYGWSVLLATMLGGLFGGVLAGLLVKILSGAVRIGDGKLNLWLIVGVTFIFFGVMGASLGLLYAWFDRQRMREGTLPQRMTYFWRVIVIFAAVMLFINLAGGAYQIYAFAGMHPPSTSPVISSETIGAAWSEPQTVPGSEDALPAASGLAASREGRLALVWTRRGAGGSEVMLSFASVNEFGQPVWERPLALSATDASAGRPQVAADSRGNWHVVWEEVDAAGSPARIMHARCAGDTCTRPVSLSSPAPACAPTISNQSAPAIAVDEADTVMVVWQAEKGPLLFSTWPAAATPPASPACLPFDGSRPQLTATGAGAFALAYQTSGGVALTRYEGNEWLPAQLLQDAGHDPALISDRAGVLHTAWCGDDGRVHYRRSGSDTTELIDSPGCLGKPALSEDGQGRVHVAWYADEVANNFGLVGPGSFIYDSVRRDDGWSPAYIVASTRAALSPAMILGPANAMQMAWADGDSLAHQASQPHYACPESTGSIYGDAILDVLASGQYRPADAFIPFCRNHYKGLLYLPDPVPVFTQKKATEYGGFDDISDEIRQARYEVLFTNMEWMRDENEDSPGFVFAQAVADLYDNLKADPQDYPRGVTVRILLGNYPEVSTFSWGEQIWNVMDVLQKAGLPELENSQLGWKVELANFDGQNPHSHAKFIVIDGRMVTSAGFNYSYLHLDKDNPSGLGISLVDFGMAFQGPVAQDAVADFDDLWSGTEKVVCPGMEPPRGDWDRYCTFEEVGTGHAPETLFYWPTKQDDVAFSLLRTYNRPESDRALEALLRSAQDTIDIFEVNFSLKVYCALGFVMDDFCSMDDSLAFMQALVDVMAQNGVRIRVLVTDVNMNGIENSVAIQVMEEELARRGLSDQAEFRYYSGRMHTKAFLVDEQFLSVGSQNFHYSAWGDDSGLVEYNLATDSPGAIDEFQRAFEYYWERGKPVTPKAVRSE